jgi:hypothetical protein
MGKVAVRASKILLQIPIALPAKFSKMILDRVMRLGKHLLLE